MSETYPGLLYISNGVLCCNSHYQKKPLPKVLNCNIFDICSSPRYISIYSTITHKIVLHFFTFSHTFLLPQLIPTLSYSSTLCPFTGQNVSSSFYFIQHAYPCFLENTLLLLPKPNAQVAK